MWHNTTSDTYKQLESKCFDEQLESKCFDEFVTLYLALPDNMKEWFYKYAKEGDAKAKAEMMRPQNNHAAEALRLRCVEFKSTIKGKYQHMYQGAIARKEGTWANKSKNLPANNFGEFWNFAPPLRMR